MTQRTIDDAVEDALCSVLDSLRLMVRFLVKHRLHRAIITITTGNNCRAEWGRTAGNFVGLTFLPDGSIRYVLFQPKPWARNGVLRRHGTINA